MRLQDCYNNNKKRIQGNKLLSKDTCVREGESGVGRQWSGQVSKYIQVTKIPMNYVSILDGAELCSAITHLSPRAVGAHKDYSSTPLSAHLSLPLKR